MHMSPLSHHMHNHQLAIGYCRAASGGVLKFYFPRTIRLLEGFSIFSAIIVRRGSVFSLASQRTVIVNNLNFYFEDFICLRLS